LNKARVKINTQEMELDNERAYSLIKAIPFMSKTIVDDTLYEKVLSFLTSVISKDHAIVHDLIKQGLFDYIKQVFLLFYFILQT
jgi:hypothetical protein